MLERWFRMAVFVATCLLGGQAWAQPTTHFTLNGVAYELVQWPAQGGSTSITSVPWSAEHGNGSISVTAPETLSSDPTVIDDFFNAAVYSDAGYGITQTPLFRVNNGQSEPAGSDVTVLYSVNASSLPTELIFYAGAQDPAGLDRLNGLKYARWSWSSSQPDTQFEVLAQSASFAVAGSGSGAMAWRTFGSLNNQALALVRITNPNGISDFSVTSNRLNAAGDDNVYGNTPQRTDYNGIAILVPRPATRVGAVPASVPALSPLALFGLSSLLLLCARAQQRRRHRT